MMDYLIIQTLIDELEKQTMELKDKESEYEYEQGIDMSDFKAGFKTAMNGVRMVFSEENYDKIMKEIAKHERQNK